MSHPRMFCACASIKVLPVARNQAIPSDLQTDMSDPKRQRMTGQPDYGYGAQPAYGQGAGMGGEQYGQPDYNAYAAGAGGPMGYAAPGYGAPMANPMGAPMGAPMGGMGMGGMGMGGMPGAGMPPQGGERVFPCVKLRGLPFECFEDDVCMFLGCEPVDILMVKRNGRFSGEAFVLLGTPLQVDYALQKNKMNMGRRYIEVFGAKRWDYYKAVANEVTDGMQGGYRGPPGGGYDPAMGGMGGPEGMPPVGVPGGPPNLAPAQLDVEHTGVLKLRGLPYSATMDDIVQWFADPSINLSTPLSPENVHLCMNHTGRANGQAFVEFATPDDSREAMVKHRQMLGNRYIELFPSSREDMARATGIPPPVSGMPGGVPPPM
eukprot:jgi/Tetstr1/428189/TSEL_018240.t1